jgi:hypothetical protein
MKSIIIILTTFIFCVGVISCKLDNYKTPDAQFFGTILDEETNKPIEQDLIEGSRIDIIELGYENPSTRQIRFHSDGTFQENNLFSGQYEVQALRGNFVPTEMTTIDIKGKTEYNFISKPYIRVENFEVSFDNLRGIVTAKFTLDQVSSNPVGTITLMADPNCNVSNSLRTLAVEKKINANVSPDKVFILQMSTENLESGRDYYFRVGALISGVSQAKPNYSSSVKLFIDNSSVVPDLAIPGKVLDNCESLDGWASGGFTLSLDSDCKEGNSSLKAAGSGVVILQKVFTPFNTEVTKENGYLAFSLYVEDTSVFGSGANDGSNQLELTSSGGPDVHEVHWSISEMNLFNGWNKVELSLEKADSDVDLSAINFLRFYHTSLKGAINIKIDNIRFYKK